MKSVALGVVLPQEVDLWEDRVRAPDNVQMSHVEMGGSSRSRSSSGPIGQGRCGFLNYMEINK